MVEKIAKRISFEQMIKILQHLPSCVFFKDTDLKYVFSTQYWNQLSGFDDDDFDIYGKTDMEIRVDKENAIKAIEEDKKILATGVGCKYPIIFNNNGETQYLEIAKEPVRDDNGEIIGITGTITDITEKVLLEIKLNELAAYDSLTKAYNRQAGTSKINDSIIESKEDKVFCIFDVNKFKHINDTYGHKVGDIVLTELSKAVMNATNRFSDIFMRLGGDEFVLLLHRKDMENKVLEVINDIFTNIEKIEIPGYEELKPTVSIGITSVKADSNFDTLYADADKKMYKAKAKNSNTYCI